MFYYEDTTPESSGSREVSTSPQHLLNFLSNGHPKAKAILVLGQKNEVSDILLRKIDPYVFFFSRQNSF